MSEHFQITYDNGTIQVFTAETFDDRPDNAGGVRFKGVSGSPSSPLSQVETLWVNVALVRSIATLKEAPA